MNWSAGDSCVDNVREKLVSFREGLRTALSPSRFIPLLLLVICLPLNAVAQANASAAAVNRYIKALQTRDYKTIVELNSNYQYDIRVIKTRNPQALWGTLLKNYYDSKISALSRNAEHDMQIAQQLLPAGTNWKVIETRSGGRSSMSQ
jgi:hypothetical protein